MQRVNPGAHLRIRDVPESERPRERMMREGAERLSNAELVAILLRTGTSSESALRLAERVLTQTGGLRELADVTLNELMNIRGIGPAKAVQLFAGIELGRRISRTLPPSEKRFVRRKMPLTGSWRRCATSSRSISFVSF